MVERLSPLKARSGSLSNADARRLGRALASCMIKKDARNLVLVGRSSTSSAKVVEKLK